MSVKVKVHVQTKYVGSKCSTTLEFSDEEWLSMSDKEKFEIFQETMFEMIEWDYEVQT